MELILNKYDDSISHKFLIRIQAIYSTLKSAEKRAADTILENPNYIVNSTIVDVAKLSGCSEATLVRLARKLGFSGYPELKSSILTEKDDNYLLYDEIQPNDSPSVIIDKVFNIIKQSLTDTQTLIDQSQYQLALKYILNANRLYFVGAGDAYAVAYAAYLKFSRIGYNVGCSKDFDVQLIEMSKFNENDVLIVISHSGRTQSLYEVAKCARLNKAKIIAITNYPISPIAKLVDAVILTASFSPNIYKEIMAKRIPELSVIETLYINALMHSDAKHQAILANSSNALAFNKID
jgi:RpiR family transcriptional regulator, carbohydrate utilization regulator